ncbi:FAD-dependent oxidoreductase [Natronosporangium hydrolyticum]|uniref:FAD-dependent oxidoreductase n=1 Tax=Natronosporangium hydrolyticum TaxID=2811111 RepID=A0A895YGK6_9ACTN|nr:FAD-dependent oxidoreductase [Natronosporangium hydrolyticum]QSB14639.1 FAD-dependent oxidoreductase [Natronosporangium hydrolyticum]
MAGKRRDAQAGEVAVVADTTQVVIVGGGFAGVACARRLAGTPGIAVTLVDQRAEQEFTPLLYQVATAELPATDVRFDLRQRLGADAGSQLQVRTATVVALTAAPDAAPGYTVTLDDGELLPGDVVVLAAGSRPAYVDVAGADRFAYPLYSIDGAVQIRDRLRQRLGPNRRGRGFQLAVVGGGATGVEAAGALADALGNGTGPLGSTTTLTLLEQGQILLPGFHDQSQQAAAAHLRERGVEIRCGATVTEVAPDHLILSTGEVIPSDLTGWAGGVTAAPLVAAAGLPTGPGGRVTVTPELTVPGYPGLYAVGDAANIPTPGAAGGWLPQLASVAAQSGQWAARAIAAARRGEPGQPFRYQDRGVLALLDRQTLIAELGERYHEVHGRLAFASWLAVHAELVPDAETQLAGWRHWAAEFYLHPARQPATAPAEPVPS